MNLPDHKTKIVCTIGPASQSREVMERMILAGMNIARLNFSHGDFDAHGKVIENLRAASRATGKRIAIMADLSGPKMRIGRLREEPVELSPGDPYGRPLHQAPASAPPYGNHRASEPPGQLHVNNMPDPEPSLMNSQILKKFPPPWRGRARVGGMLPIFQQVAASPTP